MLHLEQHFTLLVWHAVRNPLNGAAGSLQLMSSALDGGVLWECVPPAADDADALCHSLKKELDGVEECVEQALGFLTSLGMLYKCQAGEATAVPECVDLGEVLRLVARYAAPQLAEKS
eukprot:6262199-Prymnesium_polylepis.1